MHYAGAQATFFGEREHIHAALVGSVLTVERSPYRFEGISASLALAAGYELRQSQQGVARFCAANIALAEPIRWAMVCRATCGADAHNLYIDEVYLER